MRRSVRIAFCLGMALLTTACAPSAKDVKPTLAATDAGTLAFTVGERLVLSGDLAFPAGPGPFPAVVLMHGCSGLPHRPVDGWQRELRPWGYATFVVDSFSGRGFREVCTTGGLRSSERIADAYGALRLLATHPRIDRTRIVLMGFSHGGLTALTAASGWADETYGRPAGVAFRAVFAFYPSCTARSEEPVRIARPLRIHTGEADDWTPAALCVERVREFRAQGDDVDITVYPGAAHGFDSIGTPRQYLPDVLNGSACRPRVASITGPILNPEEMAACVRRGATVGWSHEATQDARRLVRAQLAELLR